MQVPKRDEYLNQFYVLVQQIYFAGYRDGFHHATGVADSTLYRLRGSNAALTSLERHRIGDELVARLERERKWLQEETDAKA